MSSPPPMGPAWPSFPPEQQQPAPSPPPSPGYPPSQGHPPSQGFAPAQRPEPPQQPSWLTPPRQDEARFGVRCPRCARTQPGPQAAQTQPRYGGPPTPLHCAYCGAPLAVSRWVASPPPGMGPPPRVRRITRPYDGPPHYGAGHPLWGFPPVARRLPAAQEPAPASVPAPLRLTSVAVVAALATALAALLAAGAEVWRYRLMLVGRFEVLPSRPVTLSNALVTATAWLALVLAVVTLLTATAVLRRWHLAAAQRGGFRAPRSQRAVAARVLVPGWNLYGAGQVIVEAARLIRRSAPGTPSDVDRHTERRGRRLLAAAWSAWLVSGAVALAVAVISLLPVFSKRWAHSNQLAANLVLMHVAVDVLATLVAVLAAAVLARLRTLWLGGKASRYDGWAVAPPESSPRNRQPDPRQADRGTTTAAPVAVLNDAEPDSTESAPAAVIDNSAKPADTESAAVVDNGAPLVVAEAGAEPGLVEPEAADTAPAVIDSNPQPAEAATAGTAPDVMNSEAEPNEKEPAEGLRSADTGTHTGQHRRR